MKMRNDFVSNSSSCSFIIHIQSDEDVEQLKLLYAKLEKKSHLTKFYCFDESWDGMSMNSTDDLEKDSFVKFDVGEDHDIETIERFDEVCSIVQDSDYEFKIYADDDAHCSIGKAWEPK